MRQYTELYNEARDLLCAHSSPIMNAARADALKALPPAFPTRRDEAYRYTDVAEAFAPDYGLNLSRLAIPVNPHEAFRCDVPNLSTSVFFVINDEFDNRHLPASALPEGVVVTSLRSLTPDKYGSLERARRAAAAPASAVPLLNTLLAQDGVYIRIPDGLRLEKPLQVVNILRSDVDLMANRRVLIDVGEGAEATILFCDHTADGDRRFLTTEVAEVFIARGAALRLYALEENSPLVSRFTHLYVSQQAASVFHHTAMTLSAGLSCNRVDVSMRGEGAACSLSGAVIADDRQRVDHATVIRHDAPGCESRELYKYVLDGHATGAFAGRVLVPHDMQRSTSSMVNANLLATTDARIYSQPVLEIYADDVQCSHGSTVGQLSDAALIYMRQRGIPEDEARTLLKQAFTAQVIDQIQLTALRDRLTHLVEKRFRGALTHCDGCRLCPRPNTSKN